MDARQTLNVLRRWVWLLIAAVLLAGGASYLVSSSLTKLYESKVTLIVGQSLQSTSTDYNQLLASQRLSQTYADLATKGKVLPGVIDQRRPGHHHGRAAQGRQRERADQQHAASRSP